MGEPIKKNYDVDLYQLTLEFRKVAVQLSVHQQGTEGWKEAYKKLQQLHAIWESFCE